PHRYDDQRSECTDRRSAGSAAGASAQAARARDQPRLPQVPAARARVPLRAASLRRGGLNFAWSCAGRGLEEAGEENMTPEQVNLVQQSFAKVAPISEQAAALFYDRLFEVAPSVQAMFPADMTEQRKKLMGTLAVVVNGLGNLGAVLPAASALAKRHVSYGSKAAHYPL